MMLYLADKVIQLYEDFESFCKWLELMEKAGVLKEVKIDKENGTISIRGCRTSTCLLRSIDPINNLVLLGFAFFGELWVYMPDAEDAFRKIKKWWKNRRG